jgi:Peptidase family M23
MNRLVAILLLVSPFAAVAQGPQYPQGYFRNPLDIPIYLAGNFGECRPGHFHSGMDIKTLGKEGQPVHAAAEGYISRIKMEPGGFGHAIYITHPNGYTTLYAHLSNLAPALQQYVQHAQYEKKRWDVDLPIDARKFPVKKGQLIAWSGNTGGSTAPHLHFEIRDTKTEHPLNAELFGLPLTDELAPMPSAITLYKGSVYENTPLTLTLEKYGEIYTVTKTDNAAMAARNDTVAFLPAATGIGIDVNDFMDGSENTLAFYTAKVFMDDQMQSMITLDDIGYDESRYVNAYADYKTRQLTHKWFQCMFRLPGNRLKSIYTYLNPYDGRLDLTDRKAHKISILLTDVKGNTATIIFYINPSLPLERYEPTKECTDFFAGKENSFSKPNVSFSLDERQLYENICFEFSEDNSDKDCSDLFHLHHGYVPLHHYFSLRLKPNRVITPDLYGKVAMLHTDDGKTTDGRAAAQTDMGWFEAPVRNLGNYWLDIDTTGPVVTSLQKNNSNLSKATEITFQATDNQTSVHNFNGYLDGKWICFEQHDDLFFYKFDAHCPKGKHKLVFTAEDENGNKTSFELTFTR